MDEILADLRSLTQSEGAMHAISSIIYRDWALVYDMVELKVAEPPERRWSTSKLNNNELMLLLGLCVQSVSDRTYSILPTNRDFCDEADRLLRELHECVLAEYFAYFNPANGKFGDGPEALSAIAREAIYYGADSFYQHQFEKFARHRYRDDGNWLVANVGLSIRPMLEIARFIVDRINLQMTHCSGAPKELSALGDLTSSLLVSRAELAAQFGQKSNAFLAKFCTQPICANLEFDGPFAINRLNIAPLIDLGEYIYVPNQYRLLQSIYESPTYWMMADPRYSDIASRNRGNFLERTAAHLLREVFGADFVYENVTIHRNRKEIAGEADVLVAYGEFVIIVQAKSKRVTLKARAGDADALKTDFDGAIQSPYRQAYEFARLIQSGAECIARDGKAIPLPPTVRIFPAVILSDAFPAATALSGELLERGEHISPVIWDIGVLDCLSRMLSSPIDFLFYLKCRSDTFETIHSDSEYNFLGYHLRAKLAIAPNVDGMMLERDFATIVDDYMIGSEVGAKCSRPEGVLERLDIPIISQLIAALRGAPPALAAIVVELYGFSSNALERIAKDVASIRREVEDGKQLKAISFSTPMGGLTYVACHKIDDRTSVAAYAIGAKHKYQARRDRWYVIIDCVGSSLAVDSALVVLDPWKEDAEEAERSMRVDEIFNSSYREV